MDTVKIVHCADLHLDSPMSALPVALAAIRKEEQKETFKRIIETTVRHGADILLIAGDLFDGEYVSFQTVKFLKDCFAALNGIRVFISPGNHDFISEGSVYSTVDFGGNVHIFRDNIEFVELPGKRARIYGYGFPGQYVHSPVLEGFKAPDDGFVNIMLIHGDTAAQSDYNPVYGIENSNLDYIALGHRHAFGGISAAGGTAYAYSGMPEGRHFDEAGPKGIIAGAVGRGYADLGFVPCAKREITVLDIDVTSCVTYDDIMKLIGGINGGGIYKITLTGTTGRDVYFDAEVLEQMLSEKTFYTKVTDRTSPLPQKSGGALQSRFEEKLAGRTDEIALMALKFGIRALKGEKIV